MLLAVRGVDINGSWLALLFAVPAALLAWRWRRRVVRPQLRLCIGEHALEQHWPVHRTIPYHTITSVVTESPASRRVDADHRLCRRGGRPERDALLHLTQETAVELATGIEARAATR